MCIVKKGSATMQTHFSNGEKITTNDWKLIDKMVDRLEISLDESIELRMFDKFDCESQTQEEKEQKKALIQEKKDLKADSVITSPKNLEWIFNDVILIAFEGKEFKSKDLWKLVSDKFSNRQTPHALTKLHKEGKLELIEGTSPKAYKIK